MMCVEIGPGATVALEQLQRATVFQDFLNGLGPGWSGTITVNAVSTWAGQIGMLQVTVAPTGNPRPLLQTLRSDTVDVLVIVTDGHQKFVVFVEQYREAVGDVVISNVAGGIEQQESPLVAAQRELQEELGSTIGGEGGLDVRFSDLLPRPCPVSPGIISEKVYHVAATIQVPPGELQEFLGTLQGKKIGVQEEGEDITLLVKPASEAYRFIASQPLPDEKTLLALQLAGL